MRRRFFLGTISSVLAVTAALGSPLGTGHGLLGSKGRSLDIGKATAPPPSVSLQGPTQIPWGNNLGVIGGGQIATFNPVGFTGVPFFSTTDISGHTGDAACFYMRGNQLWAGFGAYGKTQATYTYNVSATDGTNTAFLTVVVSNNQTFPQCAISTDFLIDTAPTYSSLGQAHAAAIAFVEGIGITGLVINDASGSPSTRFQWNAGLSMIETKDSMYPLSAHHGLFPVTLVINGGALTIQRTLGIVADPAPLIGFTAGRPAFYTTDQPGWAFGTLSFFDQSNVGYLQIVSSTGNCLAVSQDGAMTYIASPPGGTLSFTASCTYGAVVATQTFSVNVATGTLIPSAQMTASFPTRDCYLPWSRALGRPTPAQVGTVSVTGFTGSPTLKWSVDCQATVIGGQTMRFLPQLVLDGNNNATPRYTIAGTGASSAAVTAAQLSAGLFGLGETDQIMLTATDGAGQVCVKTIGFAITWPVPTGPAFQDVGPGKTWASVDALTQDMWAKSDAGNGAFYKGVKVRDFRTHLDLVPLGDYSSNDFNDFSYNTVSNGNSFHGMSPVPVWHLGGQGGSLRTEVDALGYTTASSGNGVLGAQWYDTIVEKYIGRNASNNDNCGFFFSGSFSGAALSLIDCSAFNSNNGVRAGGPGTIVGYQGVMTAMGGNGTSQRSHNNYIETLSTFVLAGQLSLQSWGSCVGHLLKMRTAGVYTLDLGSGVSFKLLDTPNTKSSSCWDVCMGGEMVVSNGVFLKNAQPDNDFNLVQMCTEPYQRGYTIDQRGIAEKSVATLTNCEFVNLCRLANGVTQASSVTYKTQTPVSMTLVNPTAFGLNSSGKVLSATWDLQRGSGPWASLYSYTAPPYGPTSTVFPWTPPSPAAIITGTTTNLAAYPFADVKIVDRLTGVAPVAPNLPNVVNTDYGYLRGGGYAGYPGLYTPLLSSTGDILTVISFPHTALVGDIPDGGVLTAYGYRTDIGTGLSASFTSGGAGLSLTVGAFTATIKVATTGLPAGTQIPFEITYSFTGYQDQGTIGTIGTVFTGNVLVT